MYGSLSWHNIYPVHLVVLVWILATRKQNILLLIWYSTSRWQSCKNYYYYYYYNRFTTLCPGLPEWVGTRRLSWVEQGLTSHQTHYRSYQGQVFTGQMTQPTVSQHWRTGTRRINHGFCWSRDDGVAVASAEPHASYLHFAPEDNHASTSSVRFLRAGCSSWHPTNSAKTRSKLS